LTVVDDHGQAAVTLAAGDLVDSDAGQSVEVTLVEHVTHDIGHDRSDGLPTDTQQPDGGGLVGSLGQPGHHRAEGAGVTSTWSRLGNVLGANSSTLRAVDRTDRGFEEALGGPEVDVTPAPGGAVVVRGGRKAARTLVGTLSPADPHHPPSAVKVTPSTTTPSMAMMRLNAVVAHM
jgi:hypothetical protein